MFLVLVVPPIVLALRSGYIGGPPPAYYKNAVVAPSLVQPIPSSTILAKEPTVSDETIRSRALSPASLRSLAVAVLRPEVKAVQPVVKEELCEAELPPATQGRRNSPTSIDASPKLLTLDPPMTKSLALPPSMGTDRPLGPGERSARDGYIPHSINSLSLRLSSALSPLFVSVNQDLREVIEAVDLLLQSVLKLQHAASQSVGGLVHGVSLRATKGAEHLAKQAAQGIQEISRQTSQSLDDISKQTSESVQGLTNKLFDMAQAVGETASFRHSRAKKNARNVREKIQKGLHDAKERAEEILADRRKARREARLLRKQAWRKRRENHKAKFRRVLNRVRLG